VVRRTVVALVGACAALAFATPVFALDCHNISRNVSPAEQAFAKTATPFVSFSIGADPQTGQPVFWNVMPLFKGNWYLLALSEGAPEPAGTTIDIWWGFIPPGTVPGVPGSNGNFTNGRVDDLLGMAACPVARQDIHGIVSAACGFGP
jgi:hypothetical protein